MKKTFVYIKKWTSPLAAAFVLAAAAFPARGAEAPAILPPRPNLTGTVRSETGQPVTNATVFIYQARPRVGPAFICPSCYADCRKSARSGTAGEFKIESIDPRLLFRVLAAAPDRLPQFVEKADPFKGPLEVSLTPCNLGQLGGKNWLRGRVLDSDGQALAGAVVNFEMYYDGNGGCGGACEGVDPLAVTDDAGNFLLTNRKTFDSMTVSVEARAFAKRKFFKLASGKAHDLRLTEGASVTGRVVKNGKPLKNIAVGIVSVDRSDDFTGDWSMATNDEGRFVFLNIPPYHAYYVYGLMDPLRELGAIPVKKVRVAADSSTKDVGDLNLIAGHVIAGRVVLSDGQPIPPNTRLTLSREQAWDWTAVELDPTGRFNLRGIPAEPVSMSVSVPGYFMPEKNKSLDRLNGGSLVGRIDRDKVDLQILLEPGNFVPPDLKARRDPGMDWQPRNQALQGAEAPSS